MNADQTKQIFSEGWVLRHEVMDVIIAPEDRSRNDEIPRGHDEAWAARSIKHGNLMVTHPSLDYVLGYVQGADDYRRPG